ncbi:MAG: hypothetical protein QOD71_1872 [Thermoleophilaceae bacterium]|jgi:hypothetical protein|nr:hypothetical protein [Thermoleophilaceae bacterium]
MHRVQRLVTVAWSVVAVGAGLGFVARDLLGLPRGVVALAWTTGALLVLAAARRGVGRETSG